MIASLFVPPNTTTFFYEKAFPGISMIRIFYDENFLSEEEVLQDGKRSHTVKILLELNDSEIVEEHTKEELVDIYESLPEKDKREFLKFGRFLLKRNESKAGTGKVDILREIEMISLNPDTQEKLSSIIDEITRKHSVSNR